MEDRLMQELKASMIAKNTVRTTVLRSLKSAITYAKVAPGAPEDGVLDDATIQGLFAKEAKKRQESADSFAAGGRPEQAEAELAEKVIIEEFLPKQLSEEEVKALVDEAVAGLEEVSPKAMGQVIGAVKAKAGTAADGALVARLVKEKLAEVSN